MRALPLEPIKIRAHVPLSGVSGRLPEEGVAWMFSLPALVLWFWADLWVELTCQLFSDVVAGRKINLWIAQLIL